MLIKRLAAFLSVLSGLSFSALAETVGKPVEKGIWLPEPANQQAAEMFDFHWLLLIIITLITIFVFLLLVWIALRYNAKRNPESATFTHNTLLEVVWTAVPVLILAAIAVPSIKLLYFQDVVPETEFAINVTGNQWNWTYNYPDHSGIEFTSVIVPNAAFENNPEGSFDPNAKAQAEEEITDHLGFAATLNARLLDTNTRLVIPVNTAIKINLTASDVIHSWTVPRFGVKLDAVPGRLNATWVKVDKIGVFYGQCSELCGKDHAYMPIAVQVVSKEDFAKWVEHAKGLYAEGPVKATTALGR
ncbi:cytochrome c oxidase subunit II [Temperatibacter marinus]|uniref:Cytochrome c oxidase subunit 2 n=1 Tax=Temperatibacter marinus TaxID=1456591 RepID=A0AA52EI30_9PROT|nr:cytochrome c oxidase subunit II [Temperatibacter marinus]WND02914.1 cytochrome c oxidase subunit II [Temperatibacter marinus]